MSHEIKNVFDFKFMVDSQNLLIICDLRSLRMFLLVDSSLLSGIHKSQSHVAAGLFELYKEDIYIVSRNTICRDRVS